MTDIQLSLTPQEVSALIQVLGQLPTSSGVYPLVMKIQQMAIAQTKEVKHEQL